ncbi:hypothetical protein R3W88_006293 [Solanum pinnatisectum]|uniref:Uncharacterized protein n=1 Tax=Solanum pinnatisectum TaxID=50273 RepID=A0AAV9KGR2_9SOLN|nr:hypothetical protein R3W88_006293 [Solanum pinnatisectum]
MPLYDCMLLLKPHVKEEALMDLVAKVGKHVYRKNGVLTDLKSFGTVQLGYGIKKLDRRYYQHRDIKFGFDFLGEDDAKADLSKFRSNIYEIEEEEEDDDDDEYNVDESTYDFHYKLLIRGHHNPNQRKIKRLQEHLQVNPWLKQILVDQLKLINFWLWDSSMTPVLVINQYVFLILIIFS